jgi:uridine phosphorylase
METFHLYHLARSYVPQQKAPAIVPPPLATSPVAPSLETTSGSSQGVIPSQAFPPLPRIRAAAAQMVFAARLSKDFITPDEVIALETWSGKGILDALTGISLPEDVSFNRTPSYRSSYHQQRVHEETGSVWDLKK